MTAEPGRIHDFASDNHAGAPDAVLEAIAAANDGHAGSYGADRWTARADELIRRHFGADARAFYVFNGTAANVLALSALARPYEAVICAESAHLNVDECGAPERIAGVKLLTVATAHGKLAPAALDGWEDRRGDQHHVQPRIVSISDATELGTVYSAAEIAGLADAAHERGMLVHLDGARLANAAAALGASLGDLTTGAGVDAVSLGGTKAGLIVGEAVVFPRGEGAVGFEFVRKQGMQLASKMRFVSAQFAALLDDDLWLRGARQANAMARRLADAVAAIDGVKVVHPVESNGVFARLPRPAIDRLLAERPGEEPFYIWPEADDEVRWMCSWDTTEADVDAFAAAVGAVVAALGPPAT